MTDGPWICVRQRAGPLVKECRALRPRISKDDSPWERAQKNRILIPRGDSSVCRTRVDRLELRLALFGFEGSFYTLTFDDANLPGKFCDVERIWSRFLYKLKRWIKRPFDYIYVIEGKHGDHRYHLHLVLRDSDFSPAEVRHLWRLGWVDDEPVLRRQYDSYRRLARYMLKESTDGITIPIGKRVCRWSQSLNSKLPRPEVFRSNTGVIRIPKDAISRGTNEVRNEFGAYRYAWYIKPKNGTKIE